MRSGTFHFRTTILPAEDKVRTRSAAAAAARVLSGFFVSARAAQLHAVLEKMAAFHRHFLKQYGGLSKL